MITSVTCRLASERPTARRLAEQQTRRLRRYFRDLRRVAWRVATRLPAGVRVSVQLSAASGRYSATGSGPSVTEAFQAVAARITRQRTRAKRIRISDRRKPAQGRAARLARGT